MLLIGVAAAFAVAGCHRGSDNVAMVGSEPITKVDYYAHLMTKTRFLGQPAQGQNGAVDVVPNPGYQALQDMIVNDLWLQVAKDQNVVPTTDDLNKELSFRLDLNPHLLDQGMQIGLSKQEIMDELKIDLCKLKLQTKGITVTPDDVDTYIKAHPNNFMTPAKIDSQVIIVRSKSVCDEVDAKIKAGVPFQTVAATYTVDPEGKQKQANYRFPITDASKMPPALMKVFNDTPEYKDTPWQTVGQGANLTYAKFYILRKEKATPMKVTDTIKEEVKRALANQKGQKAGINIDKLLVDKIEAEKGKITIYDKMYATYWTNMTDQITKAVTQMNSQGSALGAVGSTPPPPGSAPAGATAPAAGAPLAGTK
jgi:hypothetical protein